MVRKSVSTKSRMPTPYEVARDRIQILSTILLMFGLVTISAVQVLISLQLLDSRPITLFITVLSSIIVISIIIVIVALFIEFRRFEKNWSSWLKKK